MKKPPKKDVSDYAHTSASVALSLVPLIGTVLAAVFENVFSAPIDKRKEEWLTSLSETVNDLCEKVDNLTPEKLSKNEEFISACLQASNIAIRTHHSEKLKALQCAVKNTVLLQDYNESKKMIFIRVIDQMTPLHFKLLHFLSDPKFYESPLNSNRPSNEITNWGDLRNIWDATYTDIKHTDPLIDLVISDLKQLGFVRITHFYEAGLNSVSTQSGKDFLRFVSEDS